MRPPCKRGNLCTRRLSKQSKAYPASCLRWLPLLVSALHIPPAPLHHHRLQRGRELRGLHGLCRRGRRLPAFLALAPSSLLLPARAVLGNRRQPSISLSVCATLD